MKRKKKIQTRVWEQRTVQPLISTLFIDSLIFNASRWFLINEIFELINSSQWY